MKLTVLGGLNEHGRHCFLVEGEYYDFAFDCGLGTKANPFPDVTRSLAHDIRYVFVSHSHIDHTGAIDYLIRMGFHGKLVMTKETYLACKTPLRWNILMVEPGRNYYLDDGLIHFYVGKSGHCIGSVWFRVLMGGKSILYSGDYCETSQYDVDLIRAQDADMALMDGSYYHKPIPPLSESEAKLSALIQEHGGNVLLPAPANGRGLCLYALLRKLGYPVRIEGTLFDAHADTWLKTKVGEVVSDPSAKTVLFTDKDLVKPETLELVNENPSKALIFTGNLDPGSLNETLLHSRPNTYLCFYNVHESESEMDETIKANSFANTLIFSSPFTKYPKHFEF